MACDHEALGVPPALVYLPLGEADEIAVAPDIAIHPDLARKWIMGVDPATHSNQRGRMIAQWGRDMAVWRLHEVLREVTSQLNDTRGAIWAAEYLQDHDQRNEALKAHVEALRVMHEVIVTMRSEDVRPPAIHEQTAEEMRLAGVLHQKDIEEWLRAGIIYSGPSGRKQQKEIHE